MFSYFVRKAKSLTDHGLVHSESLLEIFDRLLDDLKPHELTEEERYVICLSIFLHDLGCLLGRGKHNFSSLKILKHSRFKYIENKVGSDFFACTQFAAVSHSSGYKLRRLPKQTFHPKVRLPLICALFRLIDGCDLTQSRANPTLFDILRSFKEINEESARVWRGHSAIAAVTFSQHRIVVSTSNRRKSDKLTNHLKRDLNNEINGVLREYKFPSFSIDVRRI